jgi:hypothetical protein
LSDDRDEYEKTGYLGEENIRKDTGTGDRTRNIENRTKSGIAGAISKSKLSSRY